MRLIDADVLKQHIDKLPALPDGNFAGNHSALKALINMQPTIEPSTKHVSEFPNNSTLQPICNQLATDCISRQGAIDIVDFECGEWRGLAKTIIKEIEHMPSAQPEKEIPKRVLWSGWKGYRDTRYKCPNCKKPVRNTDIYCHRCGQKLMFPNISFTPYVEGQKQELIVRWDDEE